MSSSAARFRDQARTEVSFNRDEAAVGCTDDETILLAGLRAGLDLPYECASGGCGTCKAKLVAGRVRSRWPDATGLSERDRRRGNRILMCQSIPEEPCQLQVALPDDEPDPEPMPCRSPARLMKREMLNDDTARFVLEVAEPLPFLPGQFVVLEFEDEVRRAYSMTHPYRQESGRTLDLLIRAKPGGMATKWLFTGLYLGAELVVEGPYGRAYAQSPVDRDVVCLAGGTGLAPVLAIAEQLVKESSDRRVDLYVGARTVRDLVLTDRLAALRARGANLVASVDEEGAGEHPHLDAVRKGLILDHLITEIPDLTTRDVYLAGPTPMVDAAMRELVRAGRAAADRVFFDRFY